MKFLVRPGLSALLFFLIACAHEETEDSTGTIKAGGFQVYYEKNGEGEAIVFLHAGLQNSTMWQEQVEELSRNYTVVTIDLPFHGKTTGLDTTTLAKDVVRTVLDSLHINKASVVGLSMGAAVAQDFVIGYRQRVNKAIFISAGINGYEKKYPIDSVSMAWYGKFVKALEARDTARAALEFTKAWGEGIDHNGDSLTKASSRYVYTTTLATLKDHKMAGWPNLQDEPTAFDEIATLKMPVLIIHGDKDLPFINTASVYMEKNIAGAKRVMIKGVAHMLNMEQPEEVNRLIVEFLSKN